MKLKYGLIYVLLVVHASSHSMFNKYQSFRHSQEESDEYSCEDCVATCCNFFTFTIKPSERPSTSGTSESSEYSSLTLQPERIMYMLPSWGGSRIQCVTVQNPRSTDYLPAPHKSAVVNQS